MIHSMNNIKLSVEQRHWN